MPSAINTPFGTTVQRDAYDQGDEFAAQLRQRQVEAAQNRLDRMGEMGQQNDWHRAAIGEQGREFDADQGLKSVMLQAQREALGADRDRWGKQFDYMAGRDTASDARWQKLHDEEGPSRDAQTKLMLAAIARMQSQQGRQDTAAAAPPLTGLTPEETAESNAEIAAGGTQAQANLGILGERKKKGYEEADVLGDELGSDVADFSKRDNAVTGWDPSDDEGNRIVLKEAALEKKYRDLGDPLAVAKAKAIKKVKDNARTSLNSGHVDFVLQALHIR